MLKLIILIMLLIPTASFAFNAAALNAKANEQAQVEQGKMAEQLRIKKEADQQETDRYFKENGLGWIKSKTDINVVKNRIYNIEVIRDLITAFGIKNERGERKRVYMTGKFQAYEQAYPGSKFSINAGSGTFVYGNEIIEFGNSELLEYQVKQNDGLHYTYTFADSLVTIKITDGTSKIIAKINTIEPRKSRIVDVNLPINAQSTLVQIYNKRGVTLTEKAIAGMIEGYYKDKLMPQGETFQNLMAGMLTDMDVRDGFLTYCQEVAAPVKKANSNVKAVEFQ